MKDKIYVHFGGQKEVSAFELAENETVGSFIKRLGQEGYVKELTPENWIICVEDGDELTHGDRLEHGKHKRIHICRCKKVEVGVTYNGVTKTDSFAPGTTIRRVIEWARDKFGIDKKEKLVLRLDSAEAEPLDPDSHVGSHVLQPHCQVTFYLTPKVKIEG